MKNIQLTVLDDGVGIAMMDMPGRPFNVFSEDLMDDLAELIGRARTDLTGLVLGSAKSAFVAGADLGMIKDFANMRFYANKADMKQRFSTLGRLFRELEQLPIPVVAAVNGLALGGGLEVAMACHGRVCIDVAAPILGLPEIQLGLLPGAGGTQRLPRYVGVDQAVEMLLVGNPVTPAHALAMGLVDKLSSAEHLVDDAVAMVRTMDAGARWDKQGWQVNENCLAKVTSEQWPAIAAQLGGWAGKNTQLYPAVNAIVHCIGQGLPLPMDEGTDCEWTIFVELMSDPIVANMVVTCFLNKTAAPKISQKSCMSIDKPTSYCWQSRQTQPARLAKKFTASAAGSADIAFIDGQDVDDATVGTNTVALRQVSALAEASISASLPLVSLSCAHELNSAQACEVLSEGVDGSDSLVAKTVSMASALQKIPVLISGTTGVLSPMLAALAHCLASANSQQLADAIYSVELAEAAELAGVALADEASANRDNGKSALGLTALTEMSLVAYESLRKGIISDASLLDVLAVYGIGFPKWTGGPISFLAMLQRQEVEVSLLADNVMARVSAIEIPLKNQAAYGL